MRIAKQMQLLAVMLLCAVLLAGCENAQEEAFDYYIYRINTDKTKTMAVGYTPNAEDKEDLIQEFLGQLFWQEESLNYQKAIPDNVRISSWKLEEGQLYLYFNSAYLEIIDSD